MNTKGIGKSFSNRFFVYFFFFWKIWSATARGYSARKRNNNLTVPRRIFSEDYQEIILEIRRFFWVFDVIYAFFLSKWQFEKASLELKSLFIYRLLKFYWALINVSRAVGHHCTFCTTLMLSTKNDSAIAWGLMDQHFLKLIRPCHNFSWTCLKNWVLDEVGGLEATSSD